MAKTMSKCQNFSTDHYFEISRASFIPNPNLGLKEPEGFKVTKNRIIAN